MKHLDGTKLDAPIPEVGSKWVWELGIPVAAELIEVVKVQWNGEEWQVWTRRYPMSIERGITVGSPSGIHRNDLSRFSEAVTAVGSARGRWIKWTEGRALEFPEPTE